MELAINLENKMEKNITKKFNDKNFAKITDVAWVLA